jgi:hypothetical protein
MLSIAEKCEKCSAAVENSAALRMGPAGLILGATTGWVQEI